MRNLPRPQLLIFQLNTFALAGHIHVRSHQYYLLYHIHIEKIDELKPMYREILKLKYIEDLSINQISKKIDQPINTVKIKIYRAKRILSDILELK